MTLNHDVKDRKHWLLLAGSGLTLAILTGCVQIETPTKPIEINLTINIRQDIVVKLDSSAKELIEQNGSIF